MHALQALAVLLCMFCIVVSKNESTSLFILPRQNQSGSSLPFSFFDHSCWCKAYFTESLQKCYQCACVTNFAWSVENLPQTQAGCRLQIRSSSSSTISNTLVYTCGLQVTSKTMKLITNPSGHHPRHFVPSAFVNTSVMLLSLYKYWLFLYFISTCM